MNKTKAKKLLKRVITPNNNLASYTMDWCVGSRNIMLDGDFDVDELEAIIWWMKNTHKKSRKNTARKPKPELTGTEEIYNERDDSN